MTTTRRGPLRVALALLLAAAFGVLTIAPAQAAAYRFWGFYQLTAGTWAFAQKGPDQTVPADGSVEGWRFAVGDEASTRYPRATLTFDQICAATPAQDGNKRVGVIVDFGRVADAEDATATPPEPKAVCAVVTKDSTSTDVLRAAGELRIEGGLVCSVAGYPATGCGGEVKEVSAEAKAADAPVTIAAATATPSETATSTPAPADTTAAPATTETSGSSGSNTAAYVIAGVAILALLAFLALRARTAAARRDS